MGPLTREGELEIQRDLVRNHNQIAKLTAELAAVQQSSGLASDVQAKEIVGLRTALDAANARACALREMIQDFVDNDSTPARNCSCHISPPCSDCVDNGAQRELLDLANSVLSDPAPACPHAAEHDVLMGSIGLLDAQIASAVVDQAGSNDAIVSLRAELQQAREERDALALQLMNLRQPIYPDSDIRARMDAVDDVAKAKANPAALLSARGSSIRAEERAKTLREAVDLFDECDKQYNSGIWVGRELRRLAEAAEKGGAE